jgi:hypothetical protein
MGANSSQVSSAGESFSEFSSNSVRQMWSFLDENGVHEIEIIHGTKRFLITDFVSHRPFSTKFGWYIDRYR